MISVLLTSTDPFILLKEIPYFKGNYILFIFVKRQ